jgi:lipoprotein-anchoring transpeptidase ErfK/SrfK
MQRVWIVDASGKVERTYPVSGSDENNLRPGTYHVYSKSRWAVGIDDSGVMQYFVRFAHGTDNGASIGFHSIPTKNGKPLQTVAQLGERLSHGCIRQKTSDAIAMWNFASVGTKVVVVA